MDDGCNGRDDDIDVDVVVSCVSVTLLEEVEEVGTLSTLGVCCCGGRCEIVVMELRWGAEVVVSVLGSAEKEDASTEGEKEGVALGVVIFVGARS